jgi:hypothetical protein
MSDRIDLTPILIRRVLRDVMPDGAVDEVGELFDLVPAGPEVDAIEKQESNIRLGVCQPVSQHLDVYAYILAHILSKFLASSLSPERVGDEQWMDAYEAQNLSIIRSSLWATTGALLTSDVLRYGSVAYDA